MAASETPNRRLKLVAAVAMLLASVAIYWFVGFGADPTAVAAVAPENRECDIVCQRCEAKYVISVARYLELLDSRSDATQGIICDKCGEGAAWLGEPPIEYEDRNWRAGWVGRDVLKSHLKAHHAAHPEATAKGVGVEFGN